MKKRSVLTTILTLWLSLVIGLPPGPAYALRGQNSESQKTVEGIQAGLEEGRIKKVAKGAVITAAGAAVLAAGVVGYRNFIAPKAEPPTQVAPVVPGVQQPPEVKLPEPAPSRSMDSYFERLNELSGDFSENVEFPFIASSDTDQDGAYLEVQNRGGTMMGVSSQFNFSLAIHGKASTYVILDINPTVTEVVIPFFGYIMEQAPTRREFLSYLLGGKLTDEEVAKLLEPKPREGIELYDYLKATLEETLKRFPAEQRKRWYDEHIWNNVLSGGIFPQLKRTGRLRRLEEVKGFVQDEERRFSPTLKSEVPRQTVRYFLHPDELLKGKGRAFQPQAYTDFVSFLEEHAGASWSGRKLGGWLSTEENYRTTRRYWIEGRFVGMTADLTDRASIERLTRWLQEHGKEKLSVIYPSNVSSWIGTEWSEKMYRQFRELPLREDALILQSHSPIPRLRAIPYRMLMLFYDYVAADQLPPQKNMLFIEMVSGVSTPRATDLSKFYSSLSDSVHNYLDYLDHLQRTNKGNSEETKRQQEVYKRLVGQIQNAEEDIRNLDPEGFTKWVQDWVKKNKLDLSTDTPLYRAFLWNLVDAGIIRSWSEKFWREHMPAAGLEEEFQEGDRVVFRGRSGTVVGFSQMRVKTITIAFDDKAGMAEPEETYGWDDVGGGIHPESEAPAVLPSSLDLPTDPADFLKQINTQLRRGKSTDWNRVEELWRGLIQHYRGVMTLAQLRAQQSGFQKAIGLMVRIALEAPSDSSLEGDAGPLLPRVVSELNDLFKSILAERRDRYLDESEPAIVALRADVARWVEKAVQDEEERLGRQDPEVRLRTGQGAIRPPFAAVWVMERLQTEFPNQEITAVVFRGDRLVISVDGYDRAYPRLKDFGRNVLHTHKFSGKLKASPEDTSGARAQAKQGIGDFVMSFDPVTGDPLLLEYDPRKDSLDADPAEVDPWTPHTDYHQIQGILRNAGFVTFSAGVEEGAAAARVFAEQARKEGDVRIVLGPTAFQVPGLGAAVKALQEAGLKDRFIVLPGLPPDAPKDRLPDEAADQLFSLGVGVLSLTNPFLKGYAAEDDGVMNGFQYMLQGFQVPFQRYVPSDLTLMVRQILLDLGVPEATATTEAVDRFLSLTGLEEAA